MSIALIAGLAMLVGAVVEEVALYFLLNMLLAAGATRKNYRGNDIPVSAGISLLVSVILVFLFYVLIRRYDFSFHLYLVGIISICFLGFIDDMLGQRDTLGFKGILEPVPRKTYHRRFEGSRWRHDPHFF